ncbi:MAG: hypothetical protein EBS66_15015 [Betaproteobacteria bacterium]|nr:hypothetical protein [Betaproteobacteria bacterium]
MQSKVTFPVLALSIFIPKPYTVKRKRNIKDKESGLTTTVEVNKRVRQWWFVNRDTNKVALQLRYLTKVIEFAKGKNAIEVNSGEELIIKLQKLRTVTMSGELDECINKASLLLKARFRRHLQLSMVAPI